MRPFANIAAEIFAVVAIVHLLRIFTEWEIVITGFVIPIWWSAPAFVATAALALMLEREAH
jgi:hypothetical protein